MGLGRATPTKAVAAFVCPSLRSPFAPLVPCCAGVSDRRPAPTKAASRTAIQKKCIFPADRVLMVFTTTSSSLAPDKMQLRTILSRVEKQKGFVYRNARFSNDRSEILIDIQPHGPGPTGLQQVRP